MSVQASVVLSTARTLLNDDLSTLWTDTVLFPKLAQAHRELQQKLRKMASPVMRKQTTPTEVLAAATTITSPADMVEPIRLWEGAHSADVSTFTLMTESDPLPNLDAAATLIYWQWYDEQINFIGSSANRDVMILYWRSLPIPAVNTDLVGMINAEVYLAPRVAALAAGSVGEAAVFQAMTALAESTLADVVLANRGRGTPASGAVGRP